MAKLFDWVKQTVASAPGTGVVTLGAAVATYTTFANAGIQNGETVYYTIVDGNNRERGIGTYSSTGPTLTRTWIQAKIENGVYSDNPGTGLDLSATAIVGCSPVAATHNSNGCSLSISANQSIPNGVTTNILWDVENLDTHGFHNLVTNTDRMTIPSGKGIRRIKLIASFVFSANATGERAASIFNSSGVAIAGHNIPPGLTANKAVGTVNSGEVSVSEGDYFVLGVFQSSGGALNLETGLQTWFKLEVVE